MINTEGIGLGLYIVKRMANQLNGTITVESVEKSFTRFLLALPTQQNFKRLDQEELMGVSTEEIKLTLEGLDKIEIFAVCDEVFKQASSMPVFDPARIESSN